LNAFPGSNSVVVDNRVGGVTTSDSFYMLIYPDGRVTLSDTTELLDSSDTANYLSLETWTKVTVLRQDTTFDLLFDDVVVDTTTDSTRWDSQDWALGASALGATPIDMYIDDFLLETVLT
jgi:hypothetical protein